MRKKIAAANWKMNLTFSQATQLINEINPFFEELNNKQANVIIAVPFPILNQIQALLPPNKNVFIAAQNCHHILSGAYTGEVSAALLASLSIPFVIVGHSERRQYFNETNTIIKEKIDILLANNIQPIFCCGENIALRESNNQNQFVLTQLNESLFHLDEVQIKNIIIAYEPIWAIGTGKTASKEQAQEMHHFIRQSIENKYGNHVANEISILYGGSVKGNNATEIFNQPDVDGGLVGGASLLANEFVSIFKALN
ncbi:MAG: triose-phosphate isomerase [Sediminibacterium sp.]|nr:triose-phosphate isomerase [Sediminibacterium sp.]